MTTDLGTILDFVLPERLREICLRRGVATGGSRQEQRDRLLRSLGGDLNKLLPQLMRTELVEFLATRDLGGRFAFVSRASRDELERLLTMLCAGDAGATNPQPLGSASPIRFERRVVRPPPTPPVSRSGPVSAPPPAAASEKVFRARVQRQRGLIYYVKGGDIWAAPSRHGRSKRPAQRIHEVGLEMDHVTYLYYVDGDGDIARKRRDGALLAPEVVAPKTRLPAPAGVRDGVRALDREGPLQVFIGYARADDRFLRELCAQLSPLESGGEVTLFFDNRLQAGAVWEAKLLEKLRSAEIVILLISSDFLSSQYIRTTEWPLIEERQRQGDCEVAPVLVRQCWFHRAPVGALQLIRPGDRAVDDHDKRDPAWMEVMRELDKVLERARAKRR
jgi:hypothetical protein